MPKGTEDKQIDIYQRVEELVAINTAHADEIISIKASHAIELAALQTALETVKQQLPWDVRSINAKHFEERFDKYDIKILYGVSDRPVQQFLEWLKQQEGAISLDAPEITDYFAYLVASEYIKPDRVKELTRDSTKDEQ